MKRFFKRNKGEIIDLLALIFMIWYSYFTCFTLGNNVPQLTKIYGYSCSSLCYGLPLSIQNILFMVLLLVSILYYVVNNETTKALKEYNRY